MMELKLAFTVLAFDYGKKTIGVAVGQSITGTARELSVIRLGTTKQSQRVHWEQLKKLILEWKPAKIIIGWPLNMDGTESEFCLEVKQFSEKLKKESNCPVEFMDERLTSREAKIKQNQKNGFQKNPVDSLAAQILLESWFRENL